MVLFAGIREEKLNTTEGIPVPFQGVGIILVAASIMALSFMGFTGMFQ
jgi:Na+-translocating ferredoxin:NAD+ oxidoreductase RnfA subunit